jgi:hypothetical protein
LRSAIVEKASQTTNYLDADSRLQAAKKRLERHRPGPNALLAALLFRLRVVCRVAAFTTRR